jgi:hypothetical protein
MQAGSSSDGPNMHLFAGEVQRRQSMQQAAVASGPNMHLAAEEVQRRQSQWSQSPQLLASPAARSLRWWPPARTAPALRRRCGSAGCTLGLPAYESPHVMYRFSRLRRLEALAGMCQRLHRRWLYMIFWDATAQPDLLRCFLLVGHELQVPLHMVERHDVVAIQKCWVLYSRQTLPGNWFSPHYTSTEPCQTTAYVYSTVEGMHCGPA